jgi:hypothetical protein
MSKKHAVQREKVWPRIWARYMFINDVFVFAVSCFWGNPTRDSLTLHLTRIASYLIFFAVGIARKKPRFYLPVLQEASDRDYWAVGVVGLSLIRLLVVGSFGVFGIWMQIIDILFTVSSLVSVFIAYAHRSWVDVVRIQREKRIAYLLRKTKISEDELSLIRKDLIAAVAKAEKPPVWWTIARWSVAFIIAMVLNNYVSYVISELGTHGIKLRNILPPY